MRYLLTLCLVWASLSLLSAQGWAKKFSQDTSDVQDAIKLSDGNYAILINQEYYSEAISLVKISAKGEFITRKQIGGIPTGFPSLPVVLQKKSRIITCPDNDLLLLVETIRGSMVIKIDINFNIKWQKDWIYRLPLGKIYDNAIIFIGTAIGSPEESTLIKLDFNGNKTYEKKLTKSILDFDIAKDGLVALTNMSLLKLSFNGDLLNESASIKNLIPRKNSLIKIADNKFVVAIDSFPSIYIFDKDINISKTIYSDNNSHNLAPLRNGGFIDISTYGNVFDTTYQNETLYRRYDSNGELVSKRFITDSIKRKIIAGLIPVENDNYLYFGTSFRARDFWGGNQLFAVKTDWSASYYSANISGYVKLDEDKNCQVNTFDRGINNVIVIAKHSNGQEFRGITTPKGLFDIGLPTGTYTVKAEIGNVSKYFSNCTSSLSANAQLYTPIDTMFMSIKPLISAPLMQVDITTPFLRRCFSNTYYVQYCNKGTTLAQNAFVDITLDSLLEYQGATLPLKSKTGNIYRFNLGNVDINDCGRFEIQARVRCGDSTRLNQTLCVKAKIYPDTTGTPTTSWSGANITIKGGCIGDTAVFTIKNEGTAASKSLKAKTYINEDVYEGFNVQLPVGGVMTKKYKSDKKTWRITSDQEPNHPNSTRPTAFVEPCSNEPILSLQSPAMAFSADDYALSLDEDCQPIRGAYDPNDKAGYPFGKKSIGQIPANQDLEYLIRFQNTGTDTAFTVVIKDTLPLTLDPATIEWGTSSHPYTPSFEGKNTVIFTFNNILLVDSFTNEPKSHGFVRFRIKQMPNLLNGTKIQNSAGIYFDFNPPIITNKTLHTIGADEFLSPVIETAEWTNAISVSPNPFTDKTHFRLENPLLSTGQLEIFDLNGRLLQTEVVKGQEFDFNKKNLKSGIYIFKITENGQIIGQGKIAVQ